MKKLTTGEVNLMKKYNITDVEAPATETVSNLFSGVEVKVNQAGKHIFNLVIGMQVQYDSGIKINVSEFDRLRYLFLKLWPDAYYDLLD